LASTAAARTAVAAPSTRTRTRPRPQSRRRSRTQARARRGILWIAISGILLAGVVFVSVAVLRMNIALDRANNQRADLRAQIASLQGQVATEVASWRIQSQAQQKLGLVAVDPTSIGYVDLSGK
jgi:cell division protein FtsL